MFKGLLKITVLLSLLLMQAGFTAEDKLSILFIGNSYCDFHVIPWQVSAMMRKIGVKADCRRETKGGFSLQKHWEGDKAQQRVKSEKWSYVVLQNHSKSSLEDIDNFYIYGQKFIDLVKSSGSTPVLYLTWAREDQPETQENITRAYATLGVKNNIKIAPVGEAFKACREKYPDLKLHFKDMSHPSMEGAYLSACVLYASLSGKSPVGQTSDIGGYNWVTKGKKLAEISPETAKKLQEIAWEVVQNFAPKKYALSEIPQSADSPEAGKTAQATVVPGAGTVQINFGGSNNVKGWNMVNGNQTGTVELIDALGNKTTSTIEVNDPFEAYGNPKVFTGDLRDEALLFKDASDKTVFLDKSKGNDTGEVHIKVDPNITYIIKIWASRSTGQASWGKYIIKGEKTISGFLTAGADRPRGNLSKVLTFSSVKPDAKGFISLQVVFPEKDDKYINPSQYVYLTGMILQPE